MGRTLFRATDLDRRGRRFRVRLGAGWTVAAPAGVLKRGLRRGGTDEQGVGSSGESYPDYARSSQGSGLGGLCGVRPWGSGTDSLGVERAPHLEWAPNEGTARGSRPTPREEVGCGFRSRGNAGEPSRSIGRGRSVGTGPKPPVATHASLSERTRHVTLDSLA